MTNRYRVTEVFLEPALLFSGQNKYLNISCWTIFGHKIRVPSSKKVPENYSFEYNGYYVVYLTKAKSRTLTVYKKHSN